MVESNKGDYSLFKSILKTSSDWQPFGQLCLIVKYTNNRNNTSTSCRTFKATKEQYFL